MDYSSEIKALEKYVNECQLKKTFSDTINLRIVNAKMYGAKEALKRCEKNTTKDPIRVLDELEQEFESISLWDSTQKINKEHYNIASREVHRLWCFLIDERKKHEKHC